MLAEVLSRDLRLAHAIYGNLGAPRGAERGTAAPAAAPRRFFGVLFPCGFATATSVECRVLPHRVLELFSPSAAAGATGVK